MKFSSLFKKTGVLSAILATMLFHSIFTLFKPPLKTCCASNAAITS